jgi:hypothetical protein
MTSIQVVAMRLAASRGATAVALRRGFRAARAQLTARRAGRFYPLFTE